MNLEITGRHIPVGEDLKKHLRERIAHVVKHARVDVTSVHVILAKERASHVAEIVVHGRNLDTAVRATGSDPFLASDGAADKLRHQLERQHDRRLAGRRKGATRLSEAALAAELQAAAEELAVKKPAKSRKPAAPEPPPFVRMRASRLKSMSVEQAIGKLESDGAGFVLFKDSTGQACILHRLSDGTLGLIESGIA